MGRWTAALLLTLAVTAAPATAATPQPLADKTADWLTVVLGVAVPHQVATTIPDDDGTRGWVAASIDDDGARHIHAEAWLIGDWTHPRGEWWADASGHILLHELLHGVSRDEGAVDAVALDLHAAWAHRFLPPRNQPAGYGRDIGDALYPAEVRRVRAESRAATGGGWRTRDARLWRRAHLTATGG